MSMPSEDRGASRQVDGGTRRVRRAPSVQKGSSSSRRERSGGRGVSAQGAIAKRRRSISGSENSAGSAAVDGAEMSPRGPFARSSGLAARCLASSSRSSPACDPSPSGGWPRRWARARSRKCEQGGPWRHASQPTPRGGRPSAPITQRRNLPHRPRVRPTSAGTRACQGRRRVGRQAHATTRRRAPSPRRAAPVACKGWLLGPASRRLLVLRRRAHSPWRSRPGGLGSAGGPGRQRGQQGGHRRQWGLGKHESWRGRHGWRREGRSGR
jgi:hypothetical protein